MTFVILSAGIDLSIGSTRCVCRLSRGSGLWKSGLSNRLTVRAGQEAASQGWYLAALAAIGVGVAGGLLQGFAITRLKVPPFVVTLGGMSAWRGAALLFAAGGPISGFEPNFVWIGQGRIFGQVPVPVIIFLTFAVLAHVDPSLHALRSPDLCGRRQPEAARLSGLNVRAVITSVYVIMGFFAGSAVSC